MPSLSFNLADDFVTRFVEHPENFDFSRVEFLLGHFGFEEVTTGTDYRRFKHVEFNDDLIIPVRNNDCDLLYKNIVKMLIQNYFL